MLPGITPALFGGGPDTRPTYGVDKDTVSLMKFDELAPQIAPAAGQQYKDYAKPSRVWTLIGASPGSTGSGVFAASSSYYANGNGVQSPANDTDYDIKPGQDFTIDFWALCGTTTVAQYIISKGGAAGSGGYPLYLFYQNNNTVLFFASGSGVGWDLISGAPLGSASASVWTHYAVQRRGSTWTTYCNGVQQWTATQAATFPLTTLPVAISPAISPWSGYVDELRFSKVARYSGNFSPPLEPYFGMLNDYGNDDATRILLHMDGTNGAQVFTDSAKSQSQPHVVTALGAAKTSTVQVKLGSASAQVAATDLVSIAKSTESFFGNAGNFTVDLWVYLTSGTAGHLYTARSSNATYSPFSLTHVGSGVLQVLLSFSGSTWDWGPVTIGTIPLNQWVHVAVILDRPSFRAFINGAQSYVYPGFNSGWPWFAYPVSVGNLPDYAGNTGFLDEVRFSNISRWKPGFSLATAAYNPDLNTKLLMHMDGANGGAIFPDGSPLVRGNATVATGAVTTVAGAGRFGSSSAWFNGSGYLSYPTSPDWNQNVDFTIDFWAFLGAIPPAGTSQAVIGQFGDGNSYWAVILDQYANCYLLQINGGTQYVANIIPGTVTINGWHHFAFVRSGTTITAYMDGVAGTPVTTPAMPPNLIGVLAVGCLAGSSILNQVYIDELRVLKGIAAWTANFTPPAAPYVIGNNAYGNKLLVHCDGAQNSTIFTDASPVQRGNAANAGAPVVQGPGKFGGGALTLNGTSYVAFNSSPDFEFGSGDWTIDWWENKISGNWTIARDAQTIYCPFLLAQSGIYMTSTGSSWDMAAGRGAPSVITGAWVHMAVVRKGIFFYVFQNGKLVDNWSSSAAIVGNANQFSIGCAQNLYFAGSIDEVSVSKGIAKWTADFAVPTAPYS